MDQAMNLQGEASPRSSTAGMGYKAMLASGIGHFLEWFEFATYSYLAVVFSKNFFHFASDSTSLLLSFATFGVGFVARPLGGIVLGQLGNRLGRRSLLVSTMWMMALSTFAIGCLPTYDSIGLWAPLLLVTLRLIQGFSLGGEWAAAAMYMVEWAPDSKRGFFGSLNQVSGALGLLFGSITVAMLSSTLNQEAFNNWGWRVPFFFAAVIGPIAVVIRRRIGETPAFEKLKAERTSGQMRSPVVHHSNTLKNSIVTFSLAATWSLIFYIVMSFMPVFLQKHVKIPASETFWINSLGLVALIAATPIMGAISDRVGRRPVLLAGCAVFAVFTYFLFSFLLAGGGFVEALIVEVTLALMLSLFCGPGTATLIEIFPTELRSGWMSSIYSLSTAIAGGFAPFIATWLVGATGLGIAPTFLVIGFAISGFVTVLAMRETAFNKL